MSDRLLQAGPLHVFEQDECDGPMTYWRICRYRASICACTIFITTEYNRASGINFYYILDVRNDLQTYLNSITNPMSQYIVSVHFYIGYMGGNTNVWCFTINVLEVDDSDVCLCIFYSLIMYLWYVVAVYNYMLAGSLTGWQHIQLIL